MHPSASSRRRVRALLPVLAALLGLFLMHGLADHDRGAGQVDVLATHAHVAVDALAGGGAAESGEHPGGHLMVVGLCFAVAVAGFVLLRGRAGSWPAGRHREVWFLAPGLRPDGVVLDRAPDLIALETCRC